MTKCDGAVVPDYSHSYFLTVSGSTFNAPLEWQNRSSSYAAAEEHHLHHSRVHEPRRQPGMPEVGH